ncbi:hypothetical protein [Amycolatopsis eburnea]|uniref:hypothetical protein n=1 Tax=Amycolatopsis eburnea TaxID=2267691 RepID=UPI00177FCB62|nr:hypothetical protein [Amycolatopsis eburnea]
MQPERLQVLWARAGPGVVVLVLSRELDAGTAPMLGQAAARVQANPGAGAGLPPHAVAKRHINITTADPST